MSSLALILHEALHRRWTSVLVLLVLVATVALPVALYLAGQASQRETIRLMRDLGYNLRIVPKGTDMAEFWRRGYSNGSLPGECVQRFIDRPELSYNHLIAMLHQRIEWQGVSIMLTGLATEVAPRGKKKSAMIFAVAPGTLHVGRTVAVRLGLTKGQEVVLRGRTYQIAATLAETGTADDGRVYCRLADAQAILSMPDRINEIQALECHCADPAIDTLPKLRQQLETIIPEGTVLRELDIAVSRKRTRRMNRRFVAVFVSVGLSASAFFVAMMFALNVHQRRREIGTLRALGYQSKRIGALFLGKAVLFGLIAAGPGFGLGTAFTLLVGPAIFATPIGQVVTEWWLLPVFLVGTPLFAVLAVLVPTALAVTHDPAVSLREDG